jgi:hypothetical protein
MSMGSAKLSPAGSLKSYKRRLSFIAFIGLVFPSMKCAASATETSFPFARDLAGQELTRRGIVHANFWVKYYSA